MPGPSGTAQVSQGVGTAAPAAPLRLVRPHESSPEAVLAVGGDEFRNGGSRGGKGRCSIDTGGRLGKGRARVRAGGGRLRAADSSERVGLAGGLCRCIPGCRKGDRRRRQQGAHVNGRMQSINHVSPNPLTHCTTSRRNGACIQARPDAACYAGSASPRDLARDGASARDRSDQGRMKMCPSMPTSRRRPWRSATGPATPSSTGGARSIHGRYRAWGEATCGKSLVLIGAMAVARISGPRTWDRFCQLLVRTPLKRSRNAVQRVRNTVTALPIELPRDDPDELGRLVHSRRMGSSASECSMPQNLRDVGRRSKSSFLDPTRSEFAPHLRVAGGRSSGLIPLPPDP